MTAARCIHSFPDPYPQPMTQPGDCRGCGITYQEAKDAAMTNPADELRAAAEKIRRLAMGAPANNQPWRYAKGSPSDSVRTETGWEVAYGDAPGDLRYIAAIHPGVGLALAEVFDAWARMGELDPDLLNRVGGPETLAVARAINGGQQ